jgi:hypothetical protein
MIDQATMTFKDVIADDETHANRQSRTRPYLSGHGKGLKLIRALSKAA